MLLVTAPRLERGAGQLTSGAWCVEPVSHPFQEPESSNACPQGTGRPVALGTTAGPRPPIWWAEGDRKAVWLSNPLLPGHYQCPPSPPTMVHSMNSGGQGGSWQAECCPFPMRLVLPSPKPNPFHAGNIPATVVLSRLLEPERNNRAAWDLCSAVPH